MTDWQKTEFKGVRYREHPTRKHGIMPDRYFVITYKLDGKTVSEALGWASEGNKPSGAFKILCELKRNQKQGSGPRTLAEVRAEDQQRRQESAKQARAEERLNVSLKAFFEGTYFPDAKAGWDAETARKAVEHVKNWIHPVTKDIPFRELDLTHVKKIRAKLADAGASPRTQQYVFRTFAMIWGAARDHKLVDAPCPTQADSFRLPKVDNVRQRYITHEEEARLLQAIKARSEQAYQMALVSLDAGLRFGEVASLACDCVDLPLGTLRVLDTKGKRDRSIPMTDRLKTLFKELCDGEKRGLVFPNRKGTTQTQIPSAFKRGLADAKLNEAVSNPKLKASFHTLRHTYASRLVQAGVDIRKVQLLLGHATLTQTARYSHLADSDLRQAVQAMERNGKVQKSKGKVLQMRKRRIRATG